MVSNQHGQPDLPLVSNLLIGLLLWGPIVESLPAPAWFNTGLKSVYMTGVWFVGLSIANVYWNQRLFLQTGEAKYVDVLERSLYNAVLAGVSLEPLSCNSSNGSRAARFASSIPSAIRASAKIPPRGVRLPLM